MKQQRVFVQRIVWILALFLILGSLASAGPQDRLKTYPRYEHYQKMSQEIRDSVKSGTLRVTWAEDGKSFDYEWDGKKWHFDIKTQKAVSVGDVESDQDSAQRRRRGPARGRQFTETESPDGKLKAFYRFDESPVSDYFLQLDQTKLYSSSDIEAYPKAGEPNPNFPQTSIHPSPIRSWSAFTPAPDGTVLGKPLPGPPEGREEFRGHGRTRPRPFRDQQEPDVGIFHRKPDS